MLSDCSHRIYYLLSPYTIPTSKTSQKPFQYGLPPETVSLWLSNEAVIADTYRICVASALLQAPSPLLKEVASMSPMCSLQITVHPDSFK